MLIKPSKHVDANGKVYHPYMAYWGSTPNASLLGLVAAFQEVFALSPPVYAKPTNQQYPYPPQQSNYPQQYSQPYMPPNTLQSTPPVPPKRNPSLNSLASNATVASSSVSHNTQPSTTLPKPKSEIDEKRSLVRDALTQRMQWLDQQTNADIDRLMQFNRQISHDDAVVQDMLRRVCELEKQVQQQLDSMEACAASVGPKVVALSSMPDIDVDSQIQADSAIHNQLKPNCLICRLIYWFMDCCRLVDVVSEERALDDTIYQLNRAFTASTTLQKRDLTVLIKVNPLNCAANL